MSFGFTGLDQVVGLGTNAKMNEVSAAMGLTSLNMMDEVVAANRLNYEAYSLRLAGLAGIRLLPLDDPGNYQYVIAEVTSNKLSRDHLLDALWADGIRARRYFYPGCHRMEPYASRPELPSLPVTEHLSNIVLALPTGTAITPVEIAEICAIIRLALTNAEDVKRCLTLSHQVAAAR